MTLISVLGIVSRKREDRLLLLVLYKKYTALQIVQRWHHKKKLFDTVKDKQFKGPLKVPSLDVIIEPVLKSFRPAFSLDKADYQTLTKTASSVPTILVASCFGVFVAYTLELVAKIWEAFCNETKLDFESWKVWVLTVSLVLSFLGSFIIRYLPTEKNKLLKTIRNCVNGRQKIIEARRKNSNRTGDTDAIE